MKITDNDLKRRMDWQNSRCYYCGDTLIIGDRNTGNMEIDHIKPHSKHKDGSKENLCLSCKRCNRLKSNHEIEEFRNISLNLCNGIVINDLFYFEIKGIWKGI